MAVQTVAGGKLTNEELGRFHRKVDEIKRQLNKRVLSLNSIMDGFQRMIDGDGRTSSLTTPYTTTLKIFGPDLLGLEAINRAYGLNLEEKNLPPINCSECQLKRFKKFGFQLVPQIDKMKDGNLVNIRRINDLAEGRTSDGNKLLLASNGRNISPDAWYKSQPFLDEPIKLSWRISSKQIIAGTTSTNYLNQTDLLLNHLKKVYNDRLPEKYEEPIKLFNAKRIEIASLLASGNWIKAGDILQSLSITGMIREMIPNFIYRLHLTEKTTGEKLFPSIYVWTASRASVGGFVCGGRFDSLGACVGSDGPGYASGAVGASLSLEL